MLGRVFRFSEVCISIGQVLEHVEQSTQPRHYRYLPRPEPCHALLTSARGWNTMILFRSYELRRFLGIIILQEPSLQFHSQIRYFWNLSFRKVNMYLSLFFGYRIMQKDTIHLKSIQNENDQMKRIKNAFAIHSYLDSFICSLQNNG